MGTIDTSSLGILYDMLVIASLYGCPINLYFVSYIISGLYHRLFGIAMVQAWFYFSTYLRRDHLILKLMVALIVMLDIVQFVMTTDLIYRYFVTDAVQVLQALETGRLIQFVNS
ncbi:hypothetical protein FISHEDRAFT_69695 [Fistulina hepatica ATCC 64428]|uniref:Uncharacterized protein n=1 Tax=Fistulina hepatica ATCC 64428 TaxID=1128425 RepID=A0A0D7APC1_9AGAR|nr:hypothetical protein FISHEDRAFT_69695 [Fistulina hepatica ATCC 64428]